MTNRTRQQTPALSPTADTTLGKRRGEGGVASAGVQATQTGSARHVRRPRRPPGVPRSQHTLRSPALCSGPSRRLPFPAPCAVAAKPSLKSCPWKKGWSLTFPGEQKGLEFQLSGLGRTRRSIVRYTCPKPEFTPAKTEHYSPSTSPKPFTNHPGPEKCQGQH